MRTLSNTRLAVTAALLSHLVVSLTALPAVHAQAPPQIPATFYGTVTVEGEPARDGASVRAIVNGQDCTQHDASGAIVDAGAARYVIAVVHETQVPGCGKEGDEVTFVVDGAEASPGATWHAMPQEVNLEASASASPPPSNTAGTAVATRSPVPSVPAPNEDGFPVAQTAAISVAGVLAAAAGAGFLYSRKLKGKA